MVGRICGGDGAREDGVKTVDHGVDSTGLVTDIVEFVSKVTMTGLKADIAEFVSPNIWTTS